MIVLDLYRKLEIKQRSEDVTAYMKLPWSDCYRANTVNRSQSILRDLRVQAVARKDKLSDSRGRS